MKSLETGRHEVDTIEEVEEGEEKLGTRAGVADAEAVPRAEYAESSSDDTGGGGDVENSHDVAVLYYEA